MCPNGHKCQYRHCLPENYVFQNQETEEKKNVVETDDSILIDKIDQERNNLTSKTTAVTKEKFDDWLLKRKIKQREAREL